MGAFFVSLAVTRLHRLNVERMFHMSRRYNFPIFSVLIQFAKKGPSVPRYHCRIPEAKKIARSNVHSLRNLTSKLSQY